MDISEKHEIFEIEVLEHLNAGRLLEGVVFGGGTMLRLCYELQRYSTDLYFWFLKKTDYKAYFNKARACLGKFYELTDAHIKFYTILFELRSPKYPRRLKIEIRKAPAKCDYEEMIAFSRHDTRQVMLKVFTLEEALSRKIRAALDRKDIRDFFDIEFLLKKGALSAVLDSKKDELLSILRSFKSGDYKVTLGSVLPAELRNFYVKNGFSYLASKLRC
jgi:predicted nucleotidyltransferase component of viral defense system